MAKTAITQMVDILHQNPNEYISKEDTIRLLLVNGKEIEYLAVIHHTLTISFGFWDKVRILFGKKAIIHSQIYTMNQESLVVGCEADANIEPIIKRKSIQMTHCPQ